MANQKISELNPASGLAGSDSVPVIQDSTTKRVSLIGLRASLAASGGDDISNSVKQRILGLATSGQVLRANLTNQANTSITTVRAGGGGVVDYSGTYSLASTNAERITYRTDNYEPRGQLVEEARTQSLRNTSYAGEVDGTSGTLPTNWTSQGLPSGLTRTLTKTTVNGIEFLAVRINGTAGSGGTFFIIPDSSNIASMAAVQGDPICMSLDVAVSLGTLNGITGVKLDVAEFNSSNTFLSNNDSNDYTNVLGSIPVVMKIENQAMQQATCAYARGFWKCTITNGAAIDVTFSFSRLRQEKGKFFTSYSKSSSGAYDRPTERLEIADLSTLPMRSGEYTLLVECEPRVVIKTADTTLAQFHDGTSSNVVKIGFNSTDQTGKASVVAGGVSQGTLTGQPAVVAGTINRLAIGVRKNNIALSVNGAAASKLTTATLPTITKLAVGDNGYDSNNHFNGLIRDVSIIQERLRDDELPVLSRVGSSVVDVAIIMGQSNATARALHMELPNDRFAYWNNDSHPNIFMYYKPGTWQSTANGGGTMSAGSFADDGLWYNLGPFHSDLCMRTTQASGHSNGDTVASYSAFRHGTELEIAYQHQLLYPGRELRFLKNGVDSSFIEQDWGIENATSGLLWDFFLNYIYTPAINDILAMGKTPNVLLVDWMQGESDTLNSTFANAYQGHLQKYVDRMRALPYPPHRIVINQLSTHYTSSTGVTVKAAQAAVVAANPSDCRLVVTDGSDSNPALPLMETVHYTTAGTITRAQRVWAASLT